MNDILVLQYTGRNGSRDKFLVDCRLKIAEFMQRHPTQDATLHIILREIIKNIHDHNGCHGSITVKKIDQYTIVFECSNSPNPFPETNEHQPVERVNFNAGLDLLLKSTLFKSGIEIELVDKLNYKYIVTYKYPVKYQQELG